MGDNPNERSSGSYGENRELVENGETFLRSSDRREGAASNSSRGRGRRGYQRRSRPTTEYGESEINGHRPWAGRVGRGGRGSHGGGGGFRGARTDNWRGPDSDRAEFEVDSSPRRDHGSPLRIPASNNGNNMREQTHRRNFNSSSRNERGNRHRPERGQNRPRGHGYHGHFTSSNLENQGQSYDPRHGATVAGHAPPLLSESTLNPNATPFHPNVVVDDAGFQEDSNKFDQERRDTNPNFDKVAANYSRDKNTKPASFEKNRRTVEPGVERRRSRGARAFNEGQGNEEKPAFLATTQSGKPRNQREVLMDQLARNMHECMVCCEKVRYSQPVWSCKRCFNVFHLNCIKKWASSSVDDSGWRCPGCQSNYDVLPEGYFCFCGKTKNPKSNRYDTPHTCGQVCGKPHPGGLNCTHTCIAQCHPGPCPTCEVMQIRYCGCLKTNAMVLCGSKATLSCENACSKKLNCGEHCCSRICHPSECFPCDERITYECFCKAECKEVVCTAESNKVNKYSCLRVCEKLLDCGKHTCKNICHSGSCGPCPTSTGVVISCPCGQTPIDEACQKAGMKRRKCTDPIPTCGKTCLKILSCGDVDNRHSCQHKCHQEKECPPCKLVSNIKCRCGSRVMEIPCKELRGLEITCQKKCSKKRSCGKHKCNTKCCIDVDHICPIVCQRQLRCGNHTCSSLCHLNPCLPCSVVSFDELSCECGAAIIYPPVPCGTRRPPCQLPCSREHNCDHPVHHPCHSEANCPPCTVLTEKWCHGKHELRKNVMCHITQLSCGMSCGKRLPCERHVCPKVCHPGACLNSMEICALPCDKIRNCGHPCGAACHEDDCPDSKCKIMAEVVCPCGRRNDKLICWRREIEYDRTVTWEYHKELKKLEEQAKARNEAVIIDDEQKLKIMDNTKEKIPKTTVLECDKECAKLERNKKLAEAFLLEGADVTTSIGTPNYSEFLSKFAKKNPQFIEMIHKQLADLVVKAKQSRKKNETYAFNSMNRDKRHVVHEYSYHFGILSESFDEEPNRNVVCFASKEKCYLPSVTLIDAVFRPAVRSERLKPNDDVTFRPEKRSQIVVPSSWNMRTAQNKSNGGGQPSMIALSAPSETMSGAADFPPL